MSIGPCICPQLASARREPPKRKLPSRKEDARTISPLRNTPLDAHTSLSKLSDRKPAQVAPRPVRSAVTSQVRNREIRLPRSRSRPSSHQLKAKNIIGTTLPDRRGHSSPSQPHRFSERWVGTKYPAGVGRPLVDHAPGPVVRTRQNERRRFLSQHGVGGMHRSGALD
jgi:hypothetical protein